MDKVPKTRYAKNGEVSIAYQVFGDGDIDLVVVLGYLSHVEAVWAVPPFAHFLDQLSRFSRVVLLDRRGVGMSDRVEGIATLEERMDDVRAVLDVIGIHKAAVFGQSESGPMSMLFAATYPERTAALVLYGTFARSLAAPDYEIGYEPGVIWSLAEFAADHWGEGTGVDLFAPSQAHDPVFRSTWGQFEKATSTPGGFRALIRMMLDIDARAVLPAISSKTLVLHRTDDQTVPIAAGRYVADHIPGATFAELPGYDHFVFVGDTQVVIDEIQEFLTGTRATPEPDRVLATVLFSDIVGSTSQATTLGDRAWHDRLDAHDAMVRRQLERFRGKEVKTMGDGFLATFDGPARAIQCGCAIRDGAIQLGIELRVGLHTGEVQLRGEDIGGVTVNIGARVAALARGGEVLVSRTVTDLIAGSGIAFEDRGQHELKGIPGSWSLFAVKN